MTMMQIGVLGIAGAIFAVQLRQEKAEFSIFLCIGISVLIFFSVVEKLGIVVDTLRQIGETVHIDVVYLATLCKMLGITYIAEFSSNICKDAGYQTLAGQIELFSKIMILAMGLPILTTLLASIQRFLQ